MGPRLLVGRFECVFSHYLQSSIPNRRVTNTLVYARSITNMSMTDSVTQMTILPAGARVGGLSKFGITPAGGSKAGNRLGSYVDKLKVDGSIFVLNEELEWKQMCQYQKSSEDELEMLKRKFMLPSSGLKLLSPATSEASL